MNAPKECRICFETTNQQQMVSPCLCRGTMGYIHIQCLRKVIEFSSEGKCSICHKNWIGIKVIKERKSFFNYLHEQSKCIVFILVLISLIHSIFSLFMTLLIISFKFEENLNQFDMFSIICVLVQAILLVCLLAIWLWLETIEYGKWRRVNYKFIVVECQTPTSFHNRLSQSP